MFAIFASVLFWFVCAYATDAICDNGTPVNFDKTKMKANNLGGMGPQFDDPKKIQYSEVAQVDGRSVDCIITTIGSNYLDENVDFQYRNGFWKLSGKDFVKKYNGAENGAAVIGALKRGSYKFHFEFVWTDDQSAATIPNLPLTFLLDGKEGASTCGAASAFVPKPSLIKGACGADGCCDHTGPSLDVKAPANWDQLTSQQKMASVTYIFKDASSFDFTFNLPKEHRRITFIGSSTLACASKLFEIHSDSVEHFGTGGQVFTWGMCALLFVVFGVVVVRKVQGREQVSSDLCVAIEDEDDEKGIE